MRDSLLTLLSAQIAAVAKDLPFLAGEQLWHHGHIVNVCAGYLHVVCQTRFLVDSDVRLIAKDLGVSILGLMSIGIPLPIPIFCGG